MDPLIRAFLQTTADPAWIIDRDLVFTAFNRPFVQVCEKTLKITPSIPIALDALIGDPKLNAWWRDIFARVFEGRSITADHRILLDGGERYFAISGSPVLGDNGVTQAVFTARDITSVAPPDGDDRLELALTRILTSEKPLEEVLAGVLEFVCESDGWDCAVIWLADAQNQHLDPLVIWSHPDIHSSKFHERVQELSFARGSGIPGKAWMQDDIYWVPDLREEKEFRRAEAAALAGLHGAAAVPLYDAQRVAGVLEMLTRSVRPLSEPRQRALARAGKVLGRLIVRRQLQEMIERKSREWSLTFDSIALPIFITRADGTIVRMNRVARDLAGSGEFSEILGRNIAMSDAEPWKTLADTVAAVRDSRTPCTAQIAEHLRFWDVSASWYTAASEGEERIIVVMRDTTDLVQLADSVRRGEQMAALGELVGGVAHEVRNPIFGIGITIDALRQLLPHEPDVNELFNVLRMWLDRLNRLMENLLAYGKSWTLVLEQGTLDTVLLPVVEGCRQIAAQSNVLVEGEIEPGMTMLMDSTRLGHAFENLIINAIQHSRPKQKVTVNAHIERENGRESIVCSVRDHGPGFDPAELPRVFEPFFTKRRGGTGLGLSIVHRVVDEHGGTIAAGNADDGGALVTIRFPLFRGENAERSTA